MAGFLKLVDMVESERCAIFGSLIKKELFERLIAGYDDVQLRSGNNRAFMHSYVAPWQHLAFLRGCPHIDVLSHPPRLSHRLLDGSLSSQLACYLAQELALVECWDGLSCASVSCTLILTVCFNSIHALTHQLVYIAKIQHQSQVASGYHALFQQVTIECSVLKWIYKPYSGICSCAACFFFFFFFFFF
jgi:hypothetical protein